MIHLTEYLNTASANLVKQALAASFKNPRESMFLMKYISVQKKAAELRSSHENAGLHVPPFLIASIAAHCNLHCAGCYARANSACTDASVAAELSAERWGQIFGEAAELGVSFILLAGGEPLMRGDVLRKAAENQNILFPVFTNGTMFQQENLELFDKSRNLIPVLSIEGGESKTDRRRGEGTFQILERTMNELSRRGIFYGVSITVTKENLTEVASLEFVGRLHQMGCKLAFFVEYVPADGSDGLAPGEAERKLLAEELERMRSRFEDLILVSFPGDEAQMGGCLAAGRGFFHINASGGAEPCPFSPFSDTSLRECSLRQALASPFLQKVRSNAVLQGSHDGGCVLFGRKAEVEKLLADHRI